MFRYMIGIIVVIFVLYSFRSCTTVPAGSAGVVVHMLGSSKGVDAEEVGVGRYWLGFNDELYLFPTYTQNDTWKDKESITFQTKEGLEVNADIGISYHIEPSDRKSTRLNSSHSQQSRMPSSA